MLVATTEEDAKQAAAKAMKAKRIESLVKEKTEQIKIKFYLINMWRMHVILNRINYFRFLLL